MTARKERPIAIDAADMLPSPALRAAIDAMSAVVDWTWEWKILSVGRCSAAVGQHGYTLSYEDGQTNVWRGEEHVARLDEPKRCDRWGVRWFSRVAKPWAEETARAHALGLAQDAVDAVIAGEDSPAPIVPEVRE